MLWFEHCTVSIKIKSSHCIHPQNIYSYYILTCNTFKIPYELFLTEMISITIRLKTLQALKIYC